MRVLQMDTQIWNDIAKGDMQAYETLYVAYFKKLYVYGRKFTTDVATIEDSIQEVFLDVWKKRERAASRQLPDSYFFASFRYILLKKAKQRARFYYTDHLPDMPFAPEQFTLSGEKDAALQQKLQEALRTLTPRQREAIFLRFYAGLSYEEVAAVLRISVKAAYKIMARSLAALKDALSLSLVALLFLLRTLKG
jgi:RNA polymerase sigma factor (sigma-70 family)